MLKRVFLLAAIAASIFSCGKKPQEENTNGIWLWSKYMNDVNLDTLKAKGIGNIILHEVAFKNHGEDSTLAFIHAAQERNLKVHIWFQCFYKDGKWINPVDDSLNRYKQEYFDEVIDRAKHYVGLTPVSSCRPPSCRSLTANTITDRIPPRWDSTWTSSCP